MAEHPSILPDENRENASHGLAIHHEAGIVGERVVERPRGGVGLVGVPVDALDSGVASGRVHGLDEGTAHAGASDVGSR